MVVSLIKQAIDSMKKVLSIRRDQKAHTVFIEEAVANMNLQQPDSIAIKSIGKGGITEVRYSCGYPLVLSDGFLAIPNPYYGLPTKYVWVSSIVSIQAAA